jgi:hypothetical protein
MWWHRCFRRRIDESSAARAVISTRAHWDKCFDPISAALHDAAIEHSLPAIFKLSRVTGSKFGWL